MKVKVALPRRKGKPAVKDKGPVGKVKGKMVKTQKNCVTRPVQPRSDAAMTSTRVMLAQRALDKTVATGGGGSRKGVYIDRGKAAGRQLC